MPSLIFFQERTVPAQGHKKNEINIEKVKSYFHDEDYANLALLKEVPPLSLLNKKPTFFYPGCGVDILFPLHYLEFLFPALQHISFLFVDCMNNLGMIKTILDDIGISFSEHDKTILFYWKTMFVSLTYVQGDVFSSLQSFPDFDIYFEKSFRIMKEQEETFEQKIYEKLKPGGILISDSGFQSFPFQKIKISPKLSSYNEMILAVKELSQ